MTTSMLDRLMGDNDPFDYTPQEVKQLWWFRDGSIMSVPIRQRLWEGRGLCYRHAWGYALLEIEMMAGRAFSTAILYSDFTDRAAKLFAGKRGFGRRPKLAATQPCLTCDHLRTTEHQSLTGAEWPRGAEIVNRGQNTRLLVGWCAETWQGASCPDCLGGSGPTCRPHLIAGAEPSAGISETLAGMAARLEPLVRSMTVDRTDIGDSERSSWIEAIGWFTGWKAMPRC
jgi:hypothetical protein